MRSRMDKGQRDLEDEGHGVHGEGDDEGVAVRLNEGHQVSKGGEGLEQVLLLVVWLEEGEPLAVLDAVRCMRLPRGINT